MIACRATGLGKPWRHAHPPGRERRSMFKLDEFKELESQEGADLLANFELGPEFSFRCKHPQKRWRVPWNGHWIWASHPLVRGKHLAVEAHVWHPGVLKASEPLGEYIPRRAAAYPADLNRALAIALANAIDKAAKPARRPVVDQPIFKLVLDPQPNRVKSFGKPVVDETQNEDMYSLGNVRCWANDKMKFVGVQVRNIIEDSLNANPEIESCL